MEAKVCTCCGRKLTENNTSKAYKDLCKGCYAALVRNRRQQIGKEKSNPIDWEQIRIKAAIEITAAMVTTPLSMTTIREYCTTGYNIHRRDFDEVVADAISLTDKLVEKLKGGKV